MDIRRLEEVDRRTVFHASTHLKDHASGASAARIIDSASGIRVIDAGGNEFIDAFAGLYCVNVGYGRREITQAIQRQAEKLAYYHTYVGHSNEAVIRLSEKVMAMAPKGMSKIYYGMSGSDANETQIKLVWFYNNILGRRKKKKIISRHRGYHGSGLMTGSLTGLEVFHNAFDLPLPQVRHTVAAHYYRYAEPGMSEEAFSNFCADELETLIEKEGADTVAAFIAEPVMGTGGIIPPPKGYWEAIQAVLKQYDVLLIADEVVTGFGRIGTPFGCELYAIEPDLITVAKGLTSGYLPLSGVIVGEKIWRVLEQGSEKLGPIGHGWTYSGHALCAAAGIANLEIIEREHLVENARDTGAYFQQAMHSAFDAHPLVGEVRGVGLLAALEFVADKKSRQRFEPAAKVGVRVSQACIDSGLIARAMPHGDILGFAPPLVINREQVDEVVARTRRAVDSVAETLERDKIWRAA
jgi:L-2,4-diaminobutyrate transaminase